MYKNPNLDLKLTAESVESTALPLESINNIHGGNSFPARVLGVSNSVSDYVLQKNLQHTTCLFVDQATDTLHATPPREATDRRLRDALDVVAEHLTMALSAALSQTLAALAPTRHF
ncbi:hypothetical protein ACJIZ3_010741 [Penstemon smallii]|uniref:Uncharacterized protein n=1 Tax=Penstemon smallii TaxID=265156 RepID=A0ABD3UH69_9LAMI